ncbi:hypothetical protein FRX31_024202 [Thalictrum thalictroides]|uniref:Uncharacterized protein n=1 Tax=Thalictrum thalictroides TaxID=46969 RepID=A0A7J6VN76_THATH|nr:hypothetical protein FRX31_024202 [Thalictrum thalictroides]
MTADDSNKHGPSASQSHRSALHPTHTDFHHNNRTTSSSSGRSSLSPAHMATVRSQARLRYRMQRARLAAQDASNVGLLLPRPDMTAHLQHHLASEVRRLGISSSNISVNSHTASINIDFPQGSSSHMSSAQLHEVNIFDIRSLTDWTSFQIPVDVLPHYEDSDSFEIPVDVLQPNEALIVLQKTPPQTQHCIIDKPQTVGAVQINVRTLTLQDIFST